MGYHRKTRINSDNQSVVASTIESETGHMLDAILELNMPDMGCVACIRKIDSSIRLCPSASIIRDSSSWLNDNKDEKGGKARVLLKVSSEEQAKEFVQEVTNAIEKSGLRCKL